MERLGYRKEEILQMVIQFGKGGTEANE